jgi:deoxyhypusine synthase
MVYSEATLAMPLLVGYLYHQGHWQTRRKRRWSQYFTRARE